MQARRVLALITNTAATGRVGDDLSTITKVFLRQEARRLSNTGFAVNLDEITVAAQMSGRARPLASPSCEGKHRPGTDALATGQFLKRR